MIEATPSEVATAYFAAIAARDGDAIRRLFAPSGELVTAAGTCEGPDAIAAFYEQTAFLFDDLQPSPAPFVVDGNRVAVEIDLRMAGSVMRVADFFTVTAGHIDRLVVYLLPDT